MQFLWFVIVAFNLSLRIDVAAIGSVQPQSDSRRDPQPILDNAAQPLPSAIGVASRPGEQVGQPENGDLPLWFRAGNVVATLALTAAIVYFACVQTMVSKRQWEVAADQ